MDEVDGRPVRSFVVAAAKLLSLGLVLVVGIGVVVTLADGRGRRSVARIPLDSLPDGVTPVDADGTAVIAVRNGTEVVVFAARPPRFPQGDRLVWCANVRAFLGTPSGSSYDQEGTKLTGPSPRSLDRYRSRIDGRDLVIDTSGMEYRDTRGDLVPQPIQFPPLPAPYSDDWARSVVSPGGDCPAGSPTPAWSSATTRGPPVTERSR